MRLRKRLDFNELTKGERYDLFVLTMGLIDRLERDHEDSRLKFPDSYHSRKLKEYLKMIDLVFSKIEAKRQKIQSDEDNQWKFSVVK